MDGLRLSKEIGKYWDELRILLITEELAYDDIEGLKKTKFIDRFDNAIKTSESFAVCNLADINLMLRSCNGIQNKKDRFIPLKKGDKNWEQYKNLLNNNRYNPPEKGFMYLGIDMKSNPKGKNYVKNTCLKEIRAFDNIKDGFVSTLGFKTINDNKKVLDFSKIKKYKSCDSIIYEYEKSIFDFKMNCIKTGNFRQKNRKINLFSQEMCMKMFLKFINDAIFKVVNKKLLSNQQIKNEYAPFHAFANYLEYEGYAGIIYNSTICDGLNLVLFNRDDVDIDGDILIDNINQLVL